MFIIEFWRNTSAGNTLSNACYFARRHQGWSRQKGRCTLQTQINLHRTEIFDSPSPSNLLSPTTSWAWLMPVSHADTEAWDSDEMWDILLEMPMRNLRRSTLSRWLQYLFAVLIILWTVLDAWRSFMGRQAQYALIRDLCRLQLRSVSS